MPVEPAAAASRAQVRGGGPAAAGAVPARTAGLPASLLGPGCPRHLAHQHHPRPRALFQVGAAPCPGFTFLGPLLTPSVGGTELAAVPPPARLPALTPLRPQGAPSELGFSGLLFCSQLPGRGQLVPAEGVKGRIQAGLKALGAGLPYRGFCSLPAGSSSPQSLR